MDVTFTEKLDKAYNQLQFMSKIIIASLFAFALIVEITKRSGAVSPLPLEEIHP